MSQKMNALNRLDAQIYRPSEQTANGLNFPLKLLLPFTNNRLYNVDEFKKEVILQFLHLLL